jgi:very-short-patch-repair endonuclease
MTCTVKILCGNATCNVCFNKSFASHEKAKYWSVKNLLSPYQVFKYSGKKYIFDCICGHELNTTLAHISNGLWCKYCTNHSLCNNECQECFYKSFASYEKSKYWSKKNVLTPRQVFKSSGKKFIFDCECGHEFESILNNISKGIWCPYCDNKSLCNKECHTCFKTSFASHAKSIYWSKKNVLTPRQVFKSSGKKFIFDCECGHEFETILSNISTQGQWCLYCCVPSRYLCEKNNCNQCFNKSFASHEKSKYWSKKNILIPSQVFKYSGKKFIFDCECGHEFETILSNISHGQWCSICKNKTEAKLLEWLKQNFKQFTIVRQKKFEWCRNKQRLPFDFYIKELNLIIELDGRQHFIQISNWDSPDNIRFADVFKMNAALKHDITVIRLLQEDVYKDKNDWESKLFDSIKKYESPEVVYIENSQKYEFHQADMKKLMEGINGNY